MARSSLCARASACVRQRPALKMIVFTTRLVASGWTWYTSNAAVPARPRDVKLSGPETPLYWTFSPARVARMA